MDVAFGHFCTDDFIDGLDTEYYHLGKVNHTEGLTLGAIMAMCIAVVFTNRKKGCTSCKS